jgi:hypothetical protein
LTLTFIVSLRPPPSHLQDVSITHVNCGKYHTAAISADGDVYAWGLNDSGQLGLGSRSVKAPTPAKIEAFSGRGIVQLACGQYHTLALTQDGEVYSMGFGGSFLNGAGGLGHGDRAQLEEPTKLTAFGGSSSDTGVAAVSVSAGASVHGPSASSLQVAAISHLPRPVCVRALRGTARRWIPLSGTRCGRLRLELGAWRVGSAGPRRLQRLLRTHQD